MVSSLACRERRKQAVEGALFICVLLSWSALALGQKPPPAAQVKVVQLFQEARLAEQRKDFTGALRLYDQILELDPRIAEVWTNKGLVLYELHRHREALAAFAKAAAIKPRLFSPQLFLGIEYLRLGEPAKAVKPLKAALLLEPHHPQGTLELAQAYARLERFDSAADLYRDLAEHNPSMEQAWYRLAITYVNWSKAAASRLVDSPRPSPYARLLLGHLEAVAGVFIDAETNFRAAVEQMPDAVEPRLALAHFYLDYQPTPERIQMAAEQLARAGCLDPGDTRVELSMVRVDIMRGKVAEAIARVANVLLSDVQLVRKRLPDCLLGLSPDSLRNLISGASTQQRGFARESPLHAAAASALLHAANIELGESGEAGKHEREFQDYTANLEQRGQASPLRSYSRILSEYDAGRAGAPSVGEQVGLAVGAWHLGKYDRALEVLRKALKKGPNNRALYWQSLTCLALARETLQKAVSTNPNSYRAHLLLADLANSHHDVAAAFAEYEKAVSLGRDDPEVHLLFIQFLRSKLREDEALIRAQAAVQRFPLHPALNCELGQLLLKRQRPQEAAPYFQKSLAGEPELAIARAGLADSYAALGETEKAIREMKPALHADPDGSYHYRLGRWYQRIGRPQEASKAFAASTTLKQERAKRDRERFLKLRPEY